MITVCPHCDSMVPMNREMAEVSVAGIICACCETLFHPFESLSDQSSELGIEALKDHMTIQRSLRNQSRWFEDC